MASSKLVLTSHLGIRRRLGLGCFQVVNYGALTLVMAAFGAILWTLVRGSLPAWTQIGIGGSDLDRSGQRLRNSGPTARSRGRDGHSRMALFIRRHPLFEKRVE